MRIMIAEDDPSIRDALKDMLESLDHDVVLAGDGEEAWEVFDAHPLSIIICDWLMPKLDGLELCRKIRTRPDTLYCYFILLTGNTGIEKYHEAMKQGIDDFLPKPFYLDELSIRLKVAERIVGYINHIHQLESLLPICAHCRKIRNEKDEWLDFEDYIENQTSTKFTHDICSVCLEEFFKE